MSPLKSNSFQRFMFMMMLSAGLLIVGGCSVARKIHDYYANDHCWVSDEQYAVARELFVQTGSLDLVGQRLLALQWEACARNEAIYRLQKEFEVLPEETPGLAAAPTQTRMPAVSTSTTTATTAR